jgi:hypothetical protein
VTLVSTASELAEHAASLEDLVAAALEPNVFLEPWMFLPAVEAFAGKQVLRFVLVYARWSGCGAKTPNLAGFFPLVRQRSWNTLPVPVVRIWRHVYSVLGTPLLRADCAPACWRFFLTWLRQSADGAPLLELPFVTGDGPFDQLLVDSGNDQGILSFVAERFTRALFRPLANGDEYLSAALSGKHRQELRRMERRLAEAGMLRYAVLEPNDDPAPWIAAFLELEARGWKGRHGTALARQEADRRFFHAFACATSSGTTRCTFISPAAGQICPATSVRAASCSPTQSARRSRRGGASSTFSTVRRFTRLGWRRGGVRSCNSAWLVAVSPNACGALPRPASGSSGHFGDAFIDRGALTNKNDAVECASDG